MRRLTAGVLFLLFGVLIALVPFFGVLMQLRTDGFSNVQSTVFGNGQLYLVCVGVSSAIVATYIASKDKEKPARKISAGTGVVLAVFSAYAYASSPDFNEIVASAKRMQVSARDDSSSRRAVPTHSDKTIVEYAKEDVARKNYEEDDAAKRERTSKDSVFFATVVILISVFSVMLMED